jgi:hypothetical protein
MLNKDIKEMLVVANFMDFNTVIKDNFLNVWIQIKLTLFG